MNRANRFFSNDRVSQEEILAGHFQSTRSRFAVMEGPTLVLQDTTEFTNQRERPEQIGVMPDLAAWLFDRGHGARSRSTAITRHRARSSAGLRNRILLENYFLPADLERQVAAFINH